MVAEALEANRDLRAAAQRIEQSRAQVAIARSAMWPDAGVATGVTRTKISLDTAQGIPADQRITTNYPLLLKASWEIDFWGKYRRATEAAKAELVMSEAGRDAVRASVIADVARGYFALQALDRRIEVIERTLLGREKALELQKLRLDAGVVSEFEYSQVESDLRGTQALLPTLRQQRVREDGALAVLLGRSARQIFEAPAPRGPVSTPESVEVPAGLPSDLLLRRPDLRAAEAQLHAANARIGVARAAYFPSITLTGFYGGESQDLGGLFAGPARTWSVGAGLLQPLWASGAIRGGEALATARTRELEELYQKAVSNAFREVRDAIFAQTNLREAMLRQADRERALSHTLDLSKLRYDNGAVSLFEVLETERQLLAARLEAIDAERLRRDAIVELYLALGS
jgi:multidrug efflux system outer membrane protein